MSIATLILGESGSGKSTSLRNLDPNKTLLIQCISKPLPFKSTSWKEIIKKGDGGNIVKTDDPQMIQNLLIRAPHEIIVIDDYQSIMVNELMARSSERGYDKFTSIGKNAWNIFNLAGELSENKRVYILAHTATDDQGYIRMRTVGKMVDQTIVPEGYFTIVLRTSVSNGKYSFSTQSNGQDCCKSPMDMFANLLIDNDLNFVDQAICNFYGIQETE